MKVLVKLAPLWTLVGIASLAHAHGASVRIAETTAAPGDTIRVAGEGITENGEIQLSLQGILRDYLLGTAQGGDHGRFEVDLTLPEDLQPGEYTLIAAGDETATAKLTVRVASESESAHAERTELVHGDSRNAHGEQGGLRGEAHAGEMSIEGEKTTTERVVTWGFVLLSFAFGIGLLVRRHGEK